MSEHNNNRTDAVAINQVYPNTGTGKRNMRIPVGQLQAKAFERA
jgi:hypothetical protein